MAVDRKIAGRIGFFGIQASLIILCALLLQMLYQYDTSERLNELKAAENIIELNNNSVEGMFMRMEMLSDIISSSNNNYIDILTEHNLNRVEEYQKYISFKERFTGELEIIFAGVTNNYVALWLLPDELQMTNMFAFPLSTADGTDMTPSKNGRSYIARLSKYDKLDYVSEAINSDSSIYTTIDGYTNAVYVVRHMTSQRVNSDNKFSVMNYDLGVLAVGTDFGQIFEEIGNTSILKDAKLLLINSNGRLLASNDYNIDYSLFDFSVQSGSAQGDYLVYRSVLSNGLSMITLLRADTYVSHSRSYLYFYIGIAALVVLMGFSISRYMSRSFVDPIMKLANCIAGSDRELIPERIYAKYRGEIRNLFTRYNDQMQRIDVLINNLKTQQQRENQVELRLLQTQINPHFIYNTFDTICYRELMRGEDDVARILDDVSTIMRYGISQPDLLAPLERECEILEKYLDIEHNCYDMPIRTEIDIENECRKAYVPKLILQPLVENALLHGRTTEDKEILIAIKAFEKDETLTITVSDSGKNADIEQINNGLKANIESLMTRTSGLGTLNVHLRIRRRFGERYGIHYVKSVTGNTCAIVTMPVCYDGNVE